MRGLYAIVDVDFARAHRLEVLPFAEAVLRARPAALQLRAKSLGARDTLHLLRAVDALAKAHQVPCFANDRADLASLAGCAGVHVGQEDLSVRQVRHLAPGLRVGVSTHDLGQLEAALRHRPEYVAFGPVYPTLSKHRPEPVVGLESLARAAHLAARAAVPLVAIGGVTLELAASVAALAPSVAVISALLPPEGLSGVTARARALQRLFEVG